MQQPWICVVGSINMDLVVRTPLLPVPGQTVLGGPFDTFAGGKGANQAVAAARSGGHVAMVACVGSDGYGTTLREGLAAEGIDVSNVYIRNGAATGVALIAVDPAGQNTIIVAPGANVTLTPADIEQAADIIRASAVLLLQLEVPLPVVVRAAEVARSAGTRVVLNPAPAMPLDDAVLALTDVLVPNETEASALTGLQSDGWAAAERMANALRRRGPQSVVITLGERGVVLADGEGIARQAPFAVQAVDATAAGDAFIGCLAVALAEKLPLAKAVRWGAAAGALAATRHGAQPSLPHRAQIEALLSVSS
jgi:ribokinase